MSKAILGSTTKDSVFIIYPIFAGFFLLALYVFLIDYLQLAYLPAGLIIILLFTIFFDINHYYSTYLKVFLDKEYFINNKQWIIPSTVFVLFVPIILYILVAYKSHNYEGYLYVCFLRRFLLVLGFYHLVKQNWGFMAIYKRYENEPRYKVNWELIALLSGSFIALTLFSIINPLWFPDTEKYLFTPLPEHQAFINAFWQKITQYLVWLAIAFTLIAFISKSFQLKDPAKSMAQYCLLVAVFIYCSLQFGPMLVLYCLLAGLTSIFAISLFQAVRLQRKQASINKRKWLVFATTLLLYFGVLLYPMEGDNFIKVAAITIPHNIQYLFFVPHFMRKQFAVSKKQHGIAQVLISKTASLIIVGLLFSVIFEVFRTGNNFFMPNEWALAQNLVAVFFISIVLQHYYLDAVIWKFNKEDKLAKIV